MCETGARVVGGLSNSTLCIAGNQSATLQGIFSYFTGAILVNSTSQLARVCSHTRTVVDHFHNNVWDRFPCCGWPIRFHIVYCREPVSNSSSHIFVLHSCHTYQHYSRTYVATYIPLLITNIQMYEAGSRVVVGLSGSTLCIVGNQSDIIQGIFSY